MPEPERPAPAVPPPSPPPSQSSAIWALLLTVFGGICCYIPTVVGVVKAVRILRQSDDEGVNHGRELAVSALGVAALTIGGAVFTVLTFVAFGFEDTEAAYTGPPVNADPTLVEISDLHVRDCFDDPSMRGRKGPIRTASCAKPHDAEVIASLPLLESRFPGMKAFNERARGCEDAFASYVGTPTARSALAMTYYHPTKAGWADPDARAITCVAWDPDGPMKASVRGSGR